MSQEGGCSAKAKQTMRTGACCIAGPLALLDRTGLSCCPLILCSSFASYIAVPFFHELNLCRPVHAPRARFSSCCAFKLSSRAVVSHALLAIELAIARADFELIQNLFKKHAAAHMSMWLGEKIVMRSIRFQSDERRRRGQNPCTPLICKRGLREGLCATRRGKKRGKTMEGKKQK